MKNRRLSSWNNFLLALLLIRHASKQEMRKDTRRVLKLMLKLAKKHPSLCHRALSCPARLQDEMELLNVARKKALRRNRIFPGTKHHTAPLERSSDLRMIALIMPHAREFVSTDSHAAFNRCAEMLKLAERLIPPHKNQRAFFWSETEHAAYLRLGKVKLAK